MYLVEWEERNNFTINVRKLIPFRGNRGVVELVESVESGESVELVKLVKFYSNCAKANPL